MSSASSWADPGTFVLYTSIQNCVWVFTVSYVTSKSLPLIMWHSNCLDSLRNSNLSVNLWSSTSLYQTIFKSNTQMAYCLGVVFVWALLCFPQCTFHYHSWIQNRTMVVGETHSLDYLDNVTYMYTYIWALPSISQAKRKCCNGFPILYPIKLSNQIWRGHTKMCDTAR